MNEEIGLSVTFTLPGRVMVTQQAAEKKPNRETLEYNQMKIGRDTITVKTRKSINASQTINMPLEAYNTMTSGYDKDCPAWCRRSKWQSMNSKERLEAHLDRVCESLGALSYTYVIHK